MAFPLLVTAATAERTSRPATLAEAGRALGEAVLLADAPSLAAWSPAQLERVAVILLGPGALPDGLPPFLRLRAEAGPDELDAAIAAAEQLLLTRFRLARAEDEAACARAQQVELSNVGIALSAERDIDSLLSLILMTARQLASADAGSLYLVEEEGGARFLRFVLTQNDSVASPAATVRMPVDHRSLAGFVAMSGKPVTVDDARKLPPDAPYSFNPSFDLTTGYHTRSLLTAPMRTRGGDVIGVLQLINHLHTPGVRVLSAETADQVVGPFGENEVSLIRGLAAQAAVAIENARLTGEIERLFEGFVRASVRAIEQRDPSTSGHSLRVAHYALRFAQALEQGPPPGLAGLRFTRDERTQLRYAALLHDFGKVGVREAVLTKERKLMPERFALVRERFRRACVARQGAAAQELLRELLAARRAPAATDLVRLQDTAHRIEVEAAAALAVIEAANEPAVLAREVGQELYTVAGETFPGEAGRPEPLLQSEELRALTIPRGSLVEEERREIESHVLHSYHFLLTLPWPRRFARVPEIAFGHHEKLDGSGYPRGLRDGEIAIEARLLMICDIFDALAGADRPYKRAVPAERALDILREEGRTGLLDAALVEVFVAARVWAEAPRDLALA